MVSRYKRQKYFQLASQHVSRFGRFLTLEMETLTDFGKKLRAIRESLLPWGIVFDGLDAFGEFLSLYTHYAILILTAQYGGIPEGIFQKWSAYHIQNALLLKPLLLSIETQPSIVETQRLFQENRNLLDCDLHPNGIHHYYEDFLAQHHPLTRKKTASFYTPYPIVDFMCRFTKRLIQDELGLEKGFADERIFTLEPAAGMLPFFIRALEESLISDINALNQRFSASESNPECYCLSLLLLTDWLCRHSIHPHPDKALPVHLADSLLSQTLPLKSNQIPVIIGNPPYSGHAQNKHPEIENSVRQAYLSIDNQSLNEKNTKWILDDYVRFVRRAQEWLKDKSQGIIAFLTSHNFLDNPTFRGMRHSLERDFHKLYFIDLGGNLVKESSIERDEPVFQSTGGVCIQLLVKNRLSQDSPCVRYHRIKGTREEKFQALSEIDTPDQLKERIQPKPQYFYFVPKDDRLAPQYHSFTPINQLFRAQSVGFLTHHDRLAIAFSSQEMHQKLSHFCDFSIPDDDIAMHYHLSGSISERRRAVAKLDWGEYIQPCYYRVWDKRVVFYHKALANRPRLAVLGNMLMPNIAIITQRQTYSHPFAHALAVNLPTDLNLLSPLGGGTVFPLYYYDKTDTPRPNIRTELLQNSLKYDTDPESLFYYCYAVLYSEFYRKTFGEFLKADFPKIPFTRHREKFLKLACLGRELTQLHINLQNPDDEHIVINSLRRFRYDAALETVVCNESDALGKVSPLIYGYRIGNSSPLSKWLQSRLGRALTKGDTLYWEIMATAIEKTVTCVAQIDATMESVIKENHNSLHQP